MRDWASSGRVVLFGTLLMGSVSLSTHAMASSNAGNASQHHLSHSGTALLHHSNRRFAHRHGHGGGLQCVPFARQASGIDIRGNAVNWWDAADGLYARGDIPEVGSVLNFRATGQMRLGHVAVVKTVINSREIEIDHANWRGPGLRGGRISRNISVIDVSPHNDWTAVRVALGHSDEYGSIYPTYGFIYDRPATTQEASNTALPHAEIPALNPPPHDLRLASAHRAAPAYEEVAEAPVSHHRGIDLSLGSFAQTLDSDAPTRTLR